MNFLRDAFGALKGIQFPDFPDMTPKIDDPLVYELGKMPTVHDETNTHLKNIEVDQKTLLLKVHDSLEKLNTTIKESDTKSEALGWKMFWLAVVGLVLAATQIIPAIDILRSWFKWW